jgi:hypothetical protein
MTNVSTERQTPGTTRHRITLNSPVPDIHADELAKRIFFVSDAILDFSLVRVAAGTPGTPGIHAVDVTVRAAQEDLEVLARKLRFVVANDVLAQRPLEPKVIWRRPVAREPRDVFDELLAKGVAWEAGEGQIAVGEPVLSLMDRLDAKVRALAVDEFQAREYRYPTIIPTEVLRRCAYFQSFPQLMMFVGRLHADVDSYREFLGELAAGRDLPEVLGANCGEVDYCLPPTMCFHTYHQLADRPLPVRSLAVTSRGKSFRFESRYRRALERLWDFTIREIVFLGPHDFVLRSRARLMERTFDLMAELGLGGHCEVAGDPFFVNADTAQRVWSQQFLELKYELRLPLDADRDVAVCSFNRHDRFFGESFGIEALAGAAPSTPPAPVSGWNGSHMRSSATTGRIPRAGPPPPGRRSRRECGPTPPPAALGRHRGGSGRGDGGPRVASRRRPCRAGRRRTHVADGTPGAGVPAHRRGQRGG